MNKISVYFKKLFSKNQIIKPNGKTCKVKDLNNLQLLIELLDIVDGETLSDLNRIFLTKKRVDEIFKEAYDRKLLNYMVLLNMHHIAYSKINLCTPPKHSYKEFMF